jgi:hypothetical protein
MVARKSGGGKPEHRLSFTFRLAIAAPQLPALQGRAIAQGIGRDGHAMKPPMAYGFHAGLKRIGT